MKISKIFIITILTGILGLLSGCKNPLQEHMYSSVTTSNFYQTASQAQLALNGVYSVMWDAYIYKDGKFVYLGDVPTATLQNYPDKNEDDIFAWSPSNSIFESWWSGNYQGINRANTLLDHLQKSSINSKTKNNIEGQAKFLRALYYFNLVKVFGGVPLLTHGTSNLKNVDKPRNTQKEVYAQIVKDLKDAAQEMSSYSASDHSAGKATNIAAMSLLAKVYLQQKDWKDAASEAKKVMDTGQFGLFQNYRDVFDPAHVNGKEQIFSIQHINGGDPTSQKGEHLVYEFGPPPTSLPDGTGIEFFHIQKVVYWSVQKNFFNSTPNTYRKWMTMRDKMPYYYISGTNKLVQDTVKLSRPFVVKYNYLNQSTGNLETGVDYPILRYSDILLSYAEAENEANGGPTPGAYKAINMVRERARGVGTSHAQPASVYPDLSGLSQQQFRDSVLTEEAREFVGEGRRRWELLRHDLLIPYAKARGIKADAHDKLYPIPSEEISRNPKLKQNPGY